MNEVKYKKFISFIFLIFLLDLCYSGEFREEPPDPDKTALIAITFGFVIHGAGHLYIGEELMYITLFSVELASIIAGTAGNHYFGDYSCLGENMRWSEKEKCIYGILSPTLFFSSWLYDVIAAPIKASKMRKEYEEKKRENKPAPEIGLIPADGFKGGSLSLTWRF